MDLPPAQAGSTRASASFRGKENRTARRNRIQPKREVEVLRTIQITFSQQLAQPDRVLSPPSGGWVGVCETLEAV